jgi:general secretion pathway protein L
VTVINDFLVWWGEQLSELLPERLRRQDVTGADCLLVVPDGPPDADPPAIELMQRRRGQLTRLGRFDLDGAGIRSAQRAAALTGAPMPVRLRLPPGLLLEKQLSLPLAAERDLARVVGYEMDRETPFGADEVYWESAVEQRDRGNGKLRLRLSLVPRAPIQELMRGLQAAGLAPIAIDAVLPNGQFRPIPLEGGERRRGQFGARALPAAAGACAVLAVLAVATPFIRQSLEMARIDGRVAELLPAADEANKLRRQIDGQGQSGGVLAEQRAKTGDALKVLAAVTNVLPDDTHLTDFTLRQRKLSLIGQSAAAAKLIAALSQDETCQNPSFAAPVVSQGGTTKVDVFTISAECKP